MIVVTIDEHGECKGSGRSVQGFNLHACIGACADLLIRYGGHAMLRAFGAGRKSAALRRRLNDWAARECPVLHTTPLECDLPIHLDRVTVESVRKLDQLAPYGAENPTPVFLLQNAVLDGVYPVSEGRHSRLRLRQGNASVYAVWFGMPPEQLPYAMGDVVDAALNLRSTIRPEAHSFRAAFWTCIRQGWAQSLRSRLLLWWRCAAAHP